MISEDEIKINYKQMKGSADNTKLGVTINTFLAQIADSSFIKNMNRVKYLVDLAKNIYNQKGNSNRKNSKEILRSATVLLHASLEDLLRFVCISFIDDNSGDVMDKIPLLENSNYGKPKNFTLGKLTPYKDKKIQELLRESIRDYYYQFVSFNSTNEISSHLERIGVDISKIDKYFKDLDDLIKRRHLIVHHADLINIESRTFLERAPAPISQKQVQKWIRKIDEFSLILFLDLSDGEYKRESNPMIRK